MPEFPSLVTDQVVEIRVIGRYDGQTIINTHHYRVTATLDDGVGIQEVADFFLEDMWSGATPAFRQVTVDDYELQEVAAQIVSPVRTISAVAVPEVADAPGSIAQAGLTSGASVVIRRKGVVADRHNLGRIYLAAVPGGWVSGSMITLAETSNYDNAVAYVANEKTITGTGGQNDLEPVIFNAQAPDLSPAVLVGQLDRVIRYQRRREVGVGI